MPKRPSSPSTRQDGPSTGSPNLKRQAEEQDSNPHNPNTSTNRDDSDEGMGEFEDPFEDELEQDGDDGGEVIYHNDSEDDEDDDEDAMEVDGKYSLNPFPPSCPSP